MELFLTIAVLVAIALVATSKRFYALRRSRLVTLLVSGGWPAVLAGVAFGPYGMSLVDHQTLNRASPLIVLVLGWVGVMVGLQARLEVLRRVPGELVRLVAVDAVVVVLAVGLLAAAGLGWWTGWDVPAVALLTGWGLLVASALGWSMETRSFRDPSVPDVPHAELLVRVPASLASIVAIAVFGVLSHLTAGGPSGRLELAPGPAVLGLTSTIVLAIILGVMGRSLVSHARRSVADQLVVFLGLVAFVGGLSAELGSSPLLAAMLAGIVFGNLASADVVKFEHFVIKAEHVIAALVFLLAGLVADLAIGWPGAALAIAIALARLGCKPAVLSLVLRSGNKAAQARSAASQLGPLRCVVIRQSPIAVALALGLALVEPSAFNRRLLSVVLLAGLLAELFALLRRGLPASAPARADSRDPATGAAPA